MIIDNEYVFNDLPEEYKNTSMMISDYHRKIVTEIINECLFHTCPTPIIFVGAEARFVLEDQSGFNFNVSSTMDYINSYRLIGSLYSRAMFYDVRLKHSQVIIGTDIPDINKYIVTKGRKEKLIKLNKINI